MFRQHKAAISRPHFSGSVKTKLYYCCHTYDYTIHNYMYCNSCRIFFLYFWYIRPDYDCFMQPKHVAVTGFAIIKVVCRRATSLLLRTTSFLALFNKNWENKLWIVKKLIFCLELENNYFTQEQFVNTDTFLEVNKQKHDDGKKLSVLPDKCNLSRSCIYFCGTLMTKKEQHRKFMTTADKTSDWQFRLTCDIAPYRR